MLQHCTSIPAFLSPSHLAIRLFDLVILTDGVSKNYLDQVTHQSLVLALHPEAHGHQEKITLNDLQQVSHSMESLMTDSFRSIYEIVSIDFSMWRM